jgi:hypothetical protein
MELQVTVRPGTEALAAPEPAPLAVELQVPAVQGAAVALEAQAAEAQGQAARVVEAERLINPKAKRWFRPARMRKF